MSLFLLLAEVAFNALLTESDQVVGARLRPAFMVATVLGLHTGPKPSRGTQLDPGTLRVTFAPRVGTVICKPNTCRYGRRVDEFCQQRLRANTIQQISQTCSLKRHSQESLAESWLPLIG